MIRCFAPAIVAALLTGAGALAQQKTVTIAVVNNPDMIRLKKLSSKFEEKNPDIKLNWVVLVCDSGLQLMFRSANSTRYTLAFTKLRSLPSEVGCGPWKTFPRNTTWRMSLKDCGTDSPTKGSCTRFRSTAKVPC